MKRKLAMITFIVLVALLGVAIAALKDSEFRFVDLWFTGNQQGHYHFERGEYVEAAKRFEDPLWKGIALYQKGDYESSLDQFALLETPEAFFNSGNALVHMEKYEEAVQNYDTALRSKSDYRAAKANRDLVKSWIKKKEEQPEDEEEQAVDPTFDPDEIKFGEKGKKGQEGKIEMEQLTDDQVAEIWLRRVQTSPADFLRLKFEIQAEERKKP